MEEKEGESIETTACLLYLNPNSFFLFFPSRLLCSLFVPPLPASFRVCHASDLPCPVLLRPSQDVQCADHDGRKKERKKEKEPTRDVADSA